MNDMRLPIGASLLLLLYCFSINDIPHGTTDTASYLEIAKSFYVGNGYRRISSPNNTPESLILPVYPLILVPIFFFGEMVFPIGRFISVLFTMGTIFVFYSLCNRFFNKRFSVVITLLFGLSPMIMIYSHKILTEMSFTFFSLATILSIFEYAKNPKSKFLFLSFVFVLLATFTRTAGITLLLAVILHLLLKREYAKSILFVTLLLVFFIFLHNIDYSWLSKINIADKSTEYDVRSLFVKYPQAPPLLSWNTLKFVGSNALGYFIFDVPSNLAPFFIPFRDVVFNVIPYPNLTFRNMVDSYPLLTPLITSLTYGFGLFISLIVLTGCVSLKSRDGLDVAHIYTLLLVVFILITPVYPGNGRYILPIMPLVFIYFFSGLHVLDNILTKHLVFYKNRQSIIQKLFLGFVLLSALSSAVSLASFFHFRELEPEWKAFFDAGEWLKENTNANNIIASSAPSELYLRTDRKGTDFYGINTIEDIINHNVGYILIVEDFKPEDYNKISKLVEGYPTLFKIVYQKEKPPTRIYAVRVYP